MLQVLQYQKTGEIVVEELPLPNCPRNGILVKNYFSLISAGTERSSVEKAQSSLLSRIKKQPEDVKLVLDYLKKEGIKSTLNRITNKLDSYKVLGYSSSGVVVETDTSDFQVGDRVACAGAGYANHSEYVAIPKNLAVKIPENVDYDEASYTTIGAIAMQGIRQTQPEIGEYIGVIGLGLIGLITIQILKANGINVIGYDINDNNFKLAKELGASRTEIIDNTSIETARAFSNGLFLDAVIITAATNSNQPIETALNISRKKGRIVIVGSVGMDIPRTPFYLKEIILKIACSYGPGRYDPKYEEYGIDYPYSYVRWTENRNMQSFLNLLSRKLINVKKLTTHTFDIHNAKSAYDLITNKINEKYLGILLSYNNSNTNQKKTIIYPKKIESEVKVGFIGLGSFAQNHILPALIQNKVSLVGIANQTPASSYSIGKKNGFSLISTDYKEIISNKDINVIFCASRHSSHSEIVIEAIKQGKSVFVEKPLAINFEQLSEIEKQYKINPVNLMVGYNRRFSDSFNLIKKFIEGSNYPLTMIYRINAGFIPKEHWVQNPNEGGRIIGEVCHFIDTMMYITTSKPLSIFARSISSNSLENIKDTDNVAITINFINGSVGTIIYTSMGASNLTKEYFEVHTERKSAIMNNFELVTLYDGKSKKNINMDGDKGIKNEIKEYLNSLKKGYILINFDELAIVTKTTFAVLESIETNSIINLNLNNEAI
jgi:polar amino acid transport system substrate-binding protein